MDNQRKRKLKMLKKKIYKSLIIAIVVYGIMYIFPVIVEANTLII